LGEVLKTQRKNVSCYEIFK